MTALSPAAKTTQLRIERALAKPGATGMKGLLLWTEAAFPSALSKRVLQAASKYTPGAGIGPAHIPAPTLASPASQGFGFLGDVTLSDVSFDPNQVGIDDSAAQAISDATQAPMSQTTAATPSQPASSSWISDIANAFGAASTAYLGAQQVKDAQTIFNTNLARAQQGLPMIPTNPTQYGLPSPTAQIGLTGSTSSLLMWVGGGLALALVLGGMASGRRRT